MVQPSDRERLRDTVHMDYAFMTPEEAEESMQPTLFIYDDDKKATWALAVEQKGVTEGIEIHCRSPGPVGTPGQEADFEKRSCAQHLCLEEGSFCRASGRDRADRISRMQ